MSKRKHRNDSGGGKRHSGGGHGGHFNPSQPRNTQGEWTDGLGGAQKDRMRGMLKEIQTEHTGLAAALKSGNLDRNGMDRLDKINQFALKNKELLKQLK